LKSQRTANNKFISDYFFIRRHKKMSNDLDCDCDDEIILRDDDLDWNSDDEIILENYDLNWVDRLDEYTKEKLECALCQLLGRNLHDKNAWILTKMID
jgi:hypothetical protein